MNINEILNKNELTTEEYAYLKKTAYLYTSQATGKDILSHIEKLDLINRPDTVAAIIYVTTLTFPNDLEFITEFKYSTNPNRHSLNYLQEKLKMPNKVIVSKIEEFNKFNTIDMLTNDIVLRKLAGQKPHFEAKDNKQR